MKLAFTTTALAVILGVLGSASAGTLTRVADPPGADPLSTRTASRQLCLLGVRTSEAARART